MQLKHVRTGCDTITCSRCFNFSLNRDGRNVDVEEDKITLLSTTLSSSLYILSFNGKFSGMHSCTSLAPFTVSAKLEDPVNNRVDQ